MYEPLPEPTENIPHDINAEQAVLGAILIDETALDQVDEIMIGNEWFVEKHSMIFTAMRELREDGEPVDLVTLTTRLQEKEHLELVGSVEYLTALAGSTPTAANVAYYAEIVKKKHRHRLTIKETQRLAEKAQAAEDISEVITMLQVTAQELGESQQKGKGFRPIGEMLLEHHETVERRYENRGKGLTGTKTPLTVLDKLTGGRQKQDLIIIAARPSVGKTAFVICEAKSAAVTGTTVGFLSLEMGDTPILDRFISESGDIDGMRFRNGFIEGDEWGKYTMAVGTLSNLPIYIDSDPGMTIQQIRAKARAMKRKHENLLIIIDYLQLISAGRKFQNRDTEVGYVAQQLKEMAKELDCPVIAISSIGRSCETRADKRPMLSDLRESGQIEFHADEVDFLYRDDYYDQDSAKKNIVEVIVAKGRNTGTGTCEGMYLRNFNKIIDIDYSHTEPKQTRNQPDMAARYG